MSRIVEVALNGVLASVLQTKNPQWRDAVFAEHTRILRGSAAMRPDIVVRCPNGIPVVIETEYEPANTVELDAKNRLGKVLDEGGARVEAAVAIRIPEHLGEGAEPEKRIKTGEFRMCVFTGGYLDESTIARWPETGWLTGGIDVLADMLEQVSLSERIVSEGTQLIEYAVRDAAWQLRHNIQSGGFPSILLRIAETLCQEDSEQTIRMAMAIILNALIFHTAIAGEHEVKEPKEARGLGGYLSKSKMQECWEGILKINYWPIFKIAHDLLGCIPERYTRMYLVRLVETAEAVANIGATTLNDLSGIMFQRLINDRKFLATFYTLPSSAHFAAELAVSQLDVDWADLEAIQQLRVADFACGTGTLLSAVYHRIAVRYRRRGGDDGLLHAKMVEQVLFGADIMPAATHLTTSVIASHHPTITFGKTQVFTMPYGMQPENTGLPHAIGSLDLLSDDPIKPLYSTGAEQLHGGGAELKNVVDVKAPNNSFDIVIMNPPFTRPTNHESTTIPVPSFAGFATTGTNSGLCRQRWANIVISLSAQLAMATPDSLRTL